MKSMAGAQKSRSVRKGLPNPARTKELRAAYRRFLAEPRGPRKDQAGKDLIASIFGKDAIAEDQVR